MITKPFFSMRKDGRNSRRLWEPPNKRPPEGGLSVALMELESGYVERAIPPPIIIPSLPQVLIYAALAGSVESKSRFHGRNSTSVADATHERARTTRLSIGPSSASASPVRNFARGDEHALGRGGPLFNQGVPLNRHFNGELQSKQQGQIHRGRFGLRSR